MGAHGQTSSATFCVLADCLVYGVLDAACASSFAPSPCTAKLVATTDSANTPSSTCCSQSGSTNTPSTCCAQPGAPNTPSTCCAQPGSTNTPRTCCAQPDISDQTTP